MATSTVKLYAASDTAQWKLLPDRLLKVESIEDYLATFTPTTLNNFQYIRPELEIAITVPLSQTAASPLMPSYKYVSIKNSDDSTGKIYYYFVKKAVQRSQMAVRLELVMDVLNTLNENVDYVFKPSTKITREHKDRFVNKGILIEIYIGQEQGIVGTLSPSNSVRLDWYDDQNNDWVYICNGSLVYYSDEYCSFYADVTPTNLPTLMSRLNNVVSAGKEIRVKKDDSNYASFLADSVDGNLELFRKIDPVPEGINPVLQCGDTNGAKIEHSTTLLAQNWYLLYRNQNDPSESQATSLVNPVDCYLIPENQTAVNNGVVSNGRITPNTLNGNTYYYVRLNGKTATFPDGTTFTRLSAGDYSFLVITKQENNKLSVSAYDAFISGGAISIWARNTFQFDDLDYVAIDSFPVPYYSSISQLDLENYVNNIYGNETEEFDEGYTGDYIDGISLLDRTEAKNIKLIKLPYCPYNFTVSGGKINLIGTDWYYTNLDTMKVIKLNDLNVKLNGSFNKSGGTMSAYENLFFGRLLPSINDSRQNYTYESKLYASEFYRPTYVYDSFTFVMQLEKLKLSSYYSNRNLELKFTMTSTINSKFMFTFTNYSLERGEENYAKYMVISRNNEEVLYNVPYINYIRMGYNYEKKQKSLELTSNMISTGISAIGVGASLLMPSTSLKAAAVVGMIGSFVNSTKNTVISAIKSEEDLKQKLLQKKQEAASVEGSDDVDLMSEYAGNRIKYLQYKPTDLMRNLVNDLFFYAGYNSGRMGMPSHNTRVNFDYLECDPMFEKISAIPDDCLQELVNCFKNGVTYLHKTDRATNKWDIDQIYENWEKSLL